MTDDEYKFVRGYGVSDAAVHDSVPCLDMIPEEPAYADQEVFANAAYVALGFLYRTHLKNILQFVLLLFQKNNIENQ